MSKSSFFILRFRTILLLSLTLFSLLSESSAQVTRKPSYGAITGKIADSKTGAPLAFARVQILGTGLGAITNENGDYSVQFVPVGVYSVHATIIGYMSSIKSDVTVDLNRSSVVDFQLSETTALVTEEILVEAVRPLIQRESSSTRHSVSADDLRGLPVESYQEALRLKAGVIFAAGEVHIRGGRSDEILYTVDGIPVRDPLIGGEVTVASLAVSESDMISGGLDAQYGNALSGVINVVTKEGGERFSGKVRFLTDDYGGRDKTYDNYDGLSVGIGGPTFVHGLTYFVSADATFQDTYLKTMERRPARTLFDYIKLGSRQSNEFLLQGKLSYKMGANHKLSAEFIGNRRKYDTYRHMWNKAGWVQTRRDTTSTGAEIRRYGEWSWYQKDSSYVYYNSAEHTPDTEDIFNQTKFVWSHTINRDTYYTVKLTRYSYDFSQSVQGKQPWQYEVRYPEYWWDTINFTTSRFYVTHGDYPLYYARRTKVWTVKSDMTTKLRGHKLSSGIEESYNDMRLLSILFPVEINSQGLNGNTRSDYHYYNPEGSLYIQDRWEHEGMVLNAGIRYDIFSIGSQIPAVEIRKRREKMQLSPRLGIAYPISERDVMSFHYGRYYQTPDRIYVFENRDPTTSATLGNPDLEPETTVSYQAAVQHLFNPTLVLQLGVYYKDIFGLISQREVNVEGSPVPLFKYVNEDYASARGFELTLMKRYSHNFRGEISYTYGIATGVNSDPDQARRSSYLYLPTGERPLDWDQRHTLSVQGAVSKGNKWSLGFTWAYNSGRPFSPRYAGQRDYPPSMVNSMRRPSTTTFNMEIDRLYRFWGQEVTVFAQGLNVLDAKNIVTLDPQNWPSGPGSRWGYVIYYTMTGRAGGAYNSGDNDGDGVDEFIPVNDPRVVGEGRYFRVGVSVSF